MTDNSHADDFPRRQFIKLSGGVGAAAVLAAAAPATAKGPPSFSPAELCGKNGDKDSLWGKVKDCTSGKTTCLVKDPEYVVMPGTPKNNRNYLLLPANRVKGIECDKLWNSLAGVNYWDDAWRDGSKLVKVSGGYQLALGVNSRCARGFDQLHIHMATIKTSDVKVLGTTKITNDPVRWPTQIVQITGTAKGSNPRNYRVLYLTMSDLKSNNPFVLLHKMANKAGEDMALQTMIVTKRPKGGVYILNSSSDTDPNGHCKGFPTAHLNGGTNTCDFLLDYHLSLRAPTSRPSRRISAKTTLDTCSHICLARPG